MQHLSVQDLSKTKEQRKRRPPPPPTKKKSIGRLSLDADQPTMNRRVAKSPRTTLPIKMKKGRLTAGKCKISSQDCGLECAEFRC